MAAERALASSAVGSVGRAAACIASLYASRAHEKRHPKMPFRMIKNSFSARLVSANSY
jgi:hypothetical protein